jgi:hypothetical protein
MNVAAMPLDAAVAERRVTAVTPLTIQLALEALSTWKSVIRQSLHSGGDGSSGRATTPIWPNGATRRSTLAIA